jgi:hypothetical protein
MLDDPYASVQDAMLQSGARLLCEVSSGDDDWPLSPPLPPSRWNAFKRSVARAVKGIAKLTDDESNGVARKPNSAGHDDVAPRLHGGDAGGASAGAGDDSEKSSRGGGAAAAARRSRRSRRRWSRSTACVA